MSASELNVPSQQLKPASEFEKLQVAAALVAFDRALKSTAWTVGVYALIFLLAGVIWTFSGNKSWFALGVGAVLLAEAIYLARVRSARAVLVAGLTLGLFAVWLVTNFVIAWITKDPNVGRGIIGALFLSYGAWNLLRSYRAYESLLERSDTAINIKVRDLLASLRKAKPSDLPQMIEWKLRGLGGKGIWRMLPQDGLLLLAKFRDKTFGMGGPVERALWIQRGDLRYEREGEKWIGKKLNAKLVVGSEELKISIEPEMLEKLESLLMGISPQSSAPVLKH